jgi:glutathione peroxidase
MSIYGLKVKDAKNQDVELSQYKGKALLIVNVASECGFTNQYEGLEKLYETYKDSGLEVIGFPCNQFGGQEPGSDVEIQAFCQTAFGVKFPVMAKIDVNGPSASPLYEVLKADAPGILGTEGIKWNFTKFLVSKQGKVLKRFAPQDKPEKLAKDIEAALK